MIFDRKPIQILLLGMVGYAANTCEAQTWTWLKGRTNASAAAVYGTLGVPGATNTPGARYSPTAWTGADGRFYLFGGSGDAVSGAAYLNDLWRFDPVTTNWTWIKGNPGINSNGIYGVRGNAGSTNRPGARQEGLGWTDAAGNLYLFGGYGYGASGGVGRLNDVWRFDPATTNWTWLKGGIGINSNGIYGTSGIAAATNSPGGRSVAATWTEITNKFCLFGGYGYGATGSEGELSDLWQFDPATTNWTFLKGPTTNNSLGVYGTNGIAGITNQPGGRETPGTWLGLDGRLYLFGGYGFPASGVRGFLNDLWAFDLISSNWTWLAGPVGANSNTVHGVMGVEAATNSPGGRTITTCVKTSDGQVRLFGGYGPAATTAWGELNDLWSFNPATSKWTFLRGGRVVNLSGDYGGAGVTTGDSVPGGREVAAAWPGTNGSFYLFGGYGFDDNGTNGRLNDLWVFQPAGTNAPLFLCPNKSVVEGDTGFTNLIFDVSLTFPGTGTVSVAFTTVDAGATAGVDYVATNGVLVFAPGEATKSISVQIINDTQYEVGEKFQLVLSNPTNGIVSFHPGQSGVASIIDNDTPATLIVPSVSILEGDVGTTNLVINISLSQPLATNVSVAFATVDITATAGLDYVATNGFLLFTPGQTTKSIIVQILNDLIFEGAEQFQFVLFNATNALISSAPGQTGLATILDNEDVYCKFTPTIVGYENVIAPAGYSLRTISTLKYDILVGNAFTNLALNDGCSIITLENGKYRCNNCLGGWSDPLMPILPGQGWFFKNPHGTNIFVAVAEGSANGGCAQALPAGLSLAGSAVSAGGLLQTDLGYAPASGDVIYRYNSTGNVYTAYSFTSSWSPAEPALAFGDAFWVRKTAPATWINHITGYTVDCPPSGQLGHQAASSATGQLNFFTYNATNPALGRVFYTNGTTPLDANYLGQLYGGTNASENTFVALGSPVNFLTGTGAGYLRGTEVPLPGSTGGQTGYVQLRVWKQLDGASYEAAAVLGNAVGKSAIKSFILHAAIEGSLPGLPPPDVNTFASFPLTVVQFVVPTLAISVPAPHQVRVSWTPATPGFSLQTSDSLFPPIWTNALSGSLNPVTLTVTNNTRFYRLKYN